MRVFRIKDLIDITAVFSNEFGSRIPSVKIASANLIGRLAFYLSKNKRRECLRGINQAFGSALESTNFLKESFICFWQEAFSVKQPVGIDRYKERTVFLGEEYLQEALKKGNGVILWESSSFGIRSYAKQYLHERGFSLVQVHADYHLGGFRSVHPTWTCNHFVRPYLENVMKVYLDEIIYIPMSGSLSFTRKIQDRLRKNCIICTAGDGLEGQKLFSLPFLGQSRNFSPGMISLAKSNGAPILPIFCFLSKAGKIKLLIKEPLEIPDDMERDKSLYYVLRNYVNQLEGLVLSYPGQYRHWHFGQLNS